MNKPITIRQVDGNFWSVTCEHKKYSGKIVCNSYDEAVGYAHMLGRYKLGLGDILFSYVNGLRAK